MRLFQLDGQVALVTGAGSGIGQRIAVGLAEAGADVAGLDLAATGEMPETREGVRKAGKRFLALHGNVTSPDELSAAVARVEQELGPLSVALNAAGIANAIAAEDMPVDQWRKVIEVNLTGVFLSCQAEARVMLPRRKGAIVNIASMSATIVNRGLLQVHYNASKAGVVHLSKSLAMEWADRGLRVNAISPGYTLTPMNKRPEVADRLKAYAADTPLGRIASVDEMVGPAVFLLSDAASFVTGVDLLVDGGFACW